MIKQLNTANLNDLVPLFDQYMVFYEQPSDPDRYRAYLEKRLSNDEAVVYSYYEGAEAIGFVLNYRSFSSVSLGKIVVLNDLFVVPSARARGIGEALIKHTFEFAKSLGAVRVDLGTAKTNTTAQGLYEKLGFVRDNDFFSYSYSF